MEELRKILDEFRKKIKEIEESHETDIDSFFNLDEDVREEMMGDWSPAEVSRYSYLLERSTVLLRALKILEEEALAEKFKV